MLWSLECLWFKLDKNDSLNQHKFTHFVAKYFGIVEPEQFLCQLQSQLSKLLYVSATRKIQSLT